MSDLLVRAPAGRGGAYLEPDWNVVDVDEKRCAERCRKPGGSGDGSLAGNSRWNGRIFLLPELNGDESNQEDTKDDEKGDDAAA